ncbi:MAG: antibiotic biosynthesis monooxygenase [Burkholderiaceae bacterium]|nr:antibiotic biosynthesis monooxygenase [Microbacteriaceae bacterium]
MTDTIPVSAIALYAEFTAIAGNGDAVAALIGDFGALVRLEPGNIRFDVHRLEADPLSFFVYEIYRDQAAFDTHLAAPAGAVFNGHLTPLVVGGGSTLTMLTPVL